MAKVEYLKTASLNLHERNPRFIRDKQFETLCKSIRDNPEYFEARPILCTPDRVVFAGNMRLRAAREIGLKEVPVVVMDITPEKVRELMIRDNVQNGEWDMDALAADFEVGELADWGMPDFVFGESGGPDGILDYSGKNKEIDTDGFEDKCALVLNYTLEDYEKVKLALFRISETPESAVWNLLKLDNE